MQYTNSHELYWLLYSCRVNAFSWPCLLQTQTIKDAPLLKSARIPFINELHQDSLNTNQRDNLWLQEEDISSIPDERCTHIHADVGQVLVLQFDCGFINTC